MKMRKSAVGLLVLMILFSNLFTSCKQQDRPEIKATLNISRITEEDFDGIGGTNGAGKEDFRKLKFRLEVNNCENITDRKIEVPQISKVIDAYGGDHYWFGKGTDFDTPGMDAYYSNDIMLNIQGMDNKDIKKMFQDAGIKVTWKEENGEEKEKIIEFKDIIELDE